VLIPGDGGQAGRFRLGGQAGGRVERLPVAGGVFEGDQERVGEGFGGEGLAVLAAVDGPADLCVPKTSSTSCDQAIFVNQATEASLFSDAVLVEIDRVG
jgi:hypothetical protein